MPSQTNSQGRPRGAWSAYEVALRYSLMLLAVLRGHISLLREWRYRSSLQRYTNLQAIDESLAHARGVRSLSAPNLRCVWSDEFLLYLESKPLSHSHRPARQGRIW